jgi:ATP/ADP translocase
MLSRLLYLEPCQLRRAWPFFALYLVLFAALTLADGLSLALFIVRVGTDQMPRFQALSAVCVMLSVCCYLRAAGRLDGVDVFTRILALPLLLFVLIWAALCLNILDDRALGLLFLVREVTFTVVLLHFGAYLQDHFTQAELHRVMPMIYAGGRFGGIAGGAALEHLSRFTEPANLLLLLAGLLGVSIVGLQAMERFVTRAEKRSEVAAVGWPCDHKPADASNSLRGFLSLLWCSPLLFWITLATVTLFWCRIGIAFQCNRCFERDFAGEAELSAFLGRYAQIALIASSLFQLFILSRMVDWMGLRGAHLIYAALVAAAALCGGSNMSLAAAVFGRFVEVELRYSLRNPLAQMTVNRLHGPLRTQCRAWSMGILIPATTLAAAVGLDYLLRTHSLRLVAMVTTGAAACYLAASLGLAASLTGTESQPRIRFPRPPLRRTAA